jgi:hypothetical protein
VDALEQFEKKSTLVLPSRKYKAGFFKFLKFSSLKCNKIWLVPLLDDRQCGYITK